MMGFQLQLFEGIGHPPRPKIYDNNVLEATLDSIMPAVKRWSDKNSSNFDDADDTREQLRDAIEFEDDSRRILNYLEDHYYWSVDRDLQEIMDGVADERYMALTNLVNRWVLQNGISPKYSTGQRVSFKKENKTHEGVVVRVDESVAKYLVRCEDLGHVVRGIGTHGVLIPFEETEKLF
jgi:hypothetical protein